MYADDERNEAYLKRYRAIQAAIDDLDIRTDKATFKEEAARMLAVVDEAGKGIVPPRFVADKKIALGQLDKIVKTTSLLLDQVEALNETSIVALWDSDMPTDQLQTLLNHIERTVGRAIKYVEEAKDKETKDKEKRSDECDKHSAKKGGRPSNVRAKVVTNLTAHYYFRLTGKIPTRWNSAPKSDDPHPSNLGPFVAFLQRVFKAIGLTENAEHYAKIYLKERKCNFIEDNH